MALKDEVKARYSAQLILNASNPQNSGATTIDDSRLTNACDDVEADFAIYSGVLFDLTDPRHVTVAVQGVLEKLRIYTGQVNAEEAHNRWVGHLKDLARVTGRDRIVPKTNSPVETTTDEITPGVTPTPDFDRPIYDHLIPEGPGASRPYVSP